MLQLVVPPDPASVSDARAFVLAACRDRGLPEDACDTTVLLTSELVTNALLHGRSEAQLTVSFPTGAVLVEVADDNSRRPHIAPADPGALDGRGLGMVQMLATRWGVRDEQVGKTVWFEVRAA